MRILHVIAGGEAGGAELFAQDMIVALAEMGIEQRVICRPHPLMRDRLATAEIAQVPMRFSRLDRWLGAGRRIRGEAEKWNADLVHAWMGRAASFLPPRLPCPAVGWFGGYYDLKRYRHADVFVGVTHDIRRHLLDSGIPPERAFTVHTFGTLPEAPPVERSRLETPATAPVVLVLSRLHEKKGIDTILEAMAGCPGAYLWLAGDGPARPRYEALCRKLGLTERVRFLGWRTDRRALLEAADVVALPSRYEPFGTVMAEAWATGRPLVATRTAGPSHYASDGEDCLLCPADAPAALAECLNRLLADPELRRRLSEGGRQTYERLFSKRISVEAMIGTYCQAIALGRRDAAHAGGGVLPAAPSASAR